MRGVRSVSETTKPKTIGAAGGVKVGGGGVPMLLRIVIVEVSVSGSPTRASRSSPASATVRVRVSSSSSSVSAMVSTRITVERAPAGMWKTRRSSSGLIKSFSLAVTPSRS